MTQTAFATTFSVILAVCSLLMALGIWRSSKYFALAVRQFSYLPVSDSFGRGLVRGAIPFALGITSLAIDVPILSEYTRNRSRSLLVVAVSLLALFAMGLVLQVAVAGFNRPTKLVPPYLRDDLGAWSAGASRAPDLDMEIDISDSDRMLLNAINPTSASTFFLSRVDTAESTLQLSVDPVEVASCVRSVLEEFGKSDIAESRDGDSIVLRVPISVASRTRNVVVATAVIRENTSFIFLHMYGRDGLLRLRPARKALAQISASLPTV